MSSITLHSQRYRCITDCIDPVSLPQDPKASVSLVVRAAFYLIFTIVLVIICDDMAAPPVACLAPRSARPGRPAVILRDSASVYTERTVC